MHGHDNWHQGSRTQSSASFHAQAQAQAKAEANAAAKAYARERAYNQEQSQEQEQAQAQAQAYAQAQAQAELQAQLEAQAELKKRTYKELRKAYLVYETTQREVNPKLDSTFNNHNIENAINILSTYSSLKRLELPDVQDSVIIMARLYERNKKDLFNTDPVDLAIATIDPTALKENPNLEGVFTDIYYKRNGYSPKSNGLKEFEEILKDIFPTDKKYIDNFIDDFHKNTNKTFKIFETIEDSEAKLEKALSFLDIEYQSNINYALGSIKQEFRSIDADFFNCAIIRLCQNKQAMMRARVSEEQRQAHTQTSANLGMGSSSSASSTKASYTSTGSAEATPSTSSSSSSQTSQSASSSSNYYKESILDAYIKRHNSEANNPETMENTDININNVGNKIKMIATLLGTYLAQKEIPINKDDLNEIGKGIYECYKKTQDTSIALLACISLSLVKTSPELKATQLQDLEKLEKSMLQNCGESNSNFASQKSSAAPSAFDDKSIAKSLFLSEETVKDLSPNIRQQMLLLLESSIMDSREILRTLDLDILLEEHDATQKKVLQPQPAAAPAPSAAAQAIPGSPRNISPRGSYMQQRSSEQVQEANRLG